MVAQDASERRLALAYRIILCLGATALSLAGVTGFLIYRQLRSPSWNTLLADEDLRRQAVDILVQRGAGIWDSFPDADVGRVLQTNLEDREANGAIVSSNRYGLRERPFEIPKPDGVTRIVILGDSFVFGNGVDEADRAGVFLERFLRERANGSAGDDLECLHVGLGGWNTINECAFARRQLSLLKPDLLVQVAVGNDLDDGWGVRGFGSHGWYPPSHPERGDSLISRAYGQHVLGAPRPGYLNDALDYESRDRFDRAAAAIARLAADTERLGGRYLLLIQWAGPTGARLAAGLEPGQFAFVGRAIWAEPSNWVAETDHHWNRNGHEMVAKLIYGLVQQRGLLPDVAPGPWDEATAIALESQTPEPADPTRGDDARSRLVFGRDASGGMEQVHGGIDRLGDVAPYASILLKTGGGRHLRMLGRGLDRPELDGVSVRVFVDEFPAGTLTPASSEPFDVTFELPPETLGRPFVGVRLKADDYVYRANNLRRCISLHLDELAIVP